MEISEIFDNSSLRGSRCHLGKLGNAMLILLPESLPSNTMLIPLPKPLLGNRMVMPLPKVQNHGVVQNVFGGNHLQDFALHNHSLFKMAAFSYKSC